MARFVDHLIPHLDPAQGPRRRPARLLAVVAILALLVGALSPAFAIAHQADSEGEGGGTPPPRLGNPELEPGGPETVLEALPGSAAGEEVEEDEEGPPVETEPAQEVEEPEAAVVEEAAVEAEVGVPVPAPAAAPATTEYAPAPPAPEYETAAPTTPQVVEGEAIIAPKAPTEPVDRQAEGGPPVASPPAAPPVEGPAAPTPAPAEPAVLGPDAGTHGPARIPAGHTSYTVQPGDCLWSIAEALLPPGAGEGRVAAEVARLWHLNAGRIGTGDPDLILVGTVLRLR